MIEKKERIKPLISQVDLGGNTNRGLGVTQNFFGFGVLTCKTPSISLQIKNNNSQ